MNYYASLGTASDNGYYTVLRDEIAALIIKFEKEARLSEYFKKLFAWWYRRAPGVGLRIHPEPIRRTLGPGAHKGPIGYHLLVL